MRALASGDFVVMREMVAFVRGGGEGERSWRMFSWERMERVASVVSVQWMKEMNSRVLARDRGVGWDSLRVMVMKKVMYIMGSTSTDVEGHFGDADIATQRGMGGGWHI